MNANNPLEAVKKLWPTPPPSLDENDEPRGEQVPSGGILVPDVSPQGHILAAIEHLLAARAQMEHVIPYAGMDRTRHCVETALQALAQAYPRR